jgi:hypothetical protein
VARLTSKPQPARGRSEPASGGDTGARGQVIQVATRCTTLDEFVERFAAFAWESSLVLPAAGALPVGTQGRFVILLRDQTVAMRGRCRVTEAKPTPVSSRNPAVKRVMMRVALLEMDDASRAVHKRLVALRSAPVPLPIPPEPSETTQIEPARHGGSAPVAASSPPVAAGPDPGSQVIAPPPVAPAAATAPPVPPIKAPPPAPPVALNRTMIGVGLGPDGRAILAPPALPAAPPSSSGFGAAAPAPPAAAAGGAPAASASAPSGLAVQNPPAQNLGAHNPATAATILATVPTPAPAKVEARAPRAAETLPANPLSEFNADEVDSFIECTLLEAEAAPYAHAPDGPTSADAPLAVAAAAVRRTTAYIRIKQLASRLPPNVQNKLLRVAPFAVVALVAFFVGRLIYKAPPARTPIARVAPAAPPGPAAPAPAPTAALAEPEAPAAAAAPASKKIARTEKPAPAERPAAPVEPPGAPAERAAARPVIAAGTPGACTARVITEPKDAKVIWDGKVIGNSPIDGARVPCGAAKVTIDRARWQPITLDVTMQSGDEAVVRQRLHRPHGTLVIDSSPPGAQIRVNRAPVGPAPKHLDAMRYERVTIKASLKGYQPWSKNVYLREAETKVDIQLTPRR